MPSLSEGRVQALQQAVWDACSEAFSEEEPVAGARGKPPQDPRKVVLRTIYPVLQKFARERNARRSATNQLPHELLCNIFYLLSFEDRIACSHVCHHWREISLSNPALLWDFIPADDRPDVLWDLLDRSDDAPVTLERVTITTDKSGMRIGQMLCSHMDHIKSLAIEIPNRDDYEGTPETLYDALTTPAPLLERFVVIDRAGDGFDFCDEFWSNVFGSRAPRLREIKLYGVGYDALASSLASSSVRKLYLASNGSLLAPEHIRGAFSLFPNLEELGLELRSRVRQDRLEVLVPPRTLRRLVIHFSDIPAVMNNMLSHIHHADIPEVEITFVSAGDWIYSISIGQLLAAVCGPVDNIVSLELGSTKSPPPYQYLQDVPFLIVADDHQRIRRFRGLPVDAVPAGLYGRLRALSLHVRHLTDQSSRRIFSALTLHVLVDLAVILEEDFDRGVTMSQLMASMQYQRPLDCPLLANVALCSPPQYAKVKTDIPAEDAVQLLRRCLRYDAEKLASLKFCGLTLLPATDDPMATVRNIAHEIVFEKAGPDLYWPLQQALDWS